MKYETYEILVFILIRCLILWKILLYFSEPNNAKYLVIFSKAMYFIEHRMQVRFCTNPSFVRNVINQNTFMWSFIKQNVIQIKTINSNYVIKIITRTDFEINFFSQFLYCYCVNSFSVLTYDLRNDSK